jgi:hypothetical protein
MNVKMAADGLKVGFVASDHCGFPQPESSVVLSEAEFDSVPRGPARTTVPRLAWRHEAASDKG